VRASAANTAAETKADRAFIVSEVVLEAAKVMRSAPTTKPAPESIDGRRGPDAARHEVADAA
jgi:hypothetical protein